MKARRCFNHANGFNCLVFANNRLRSLMRNWKKLKASSRDDVLDRSRNRFVLKRYFITIFKRSQLQ